MIYIVYNRFCFWFHCRKLVNHVIKICYRLLFSNVFFFPRSCPTDTRKYDRLSFNLLNDRSQLAIVLNLWSPMYDLSVWDTWGSGWAHSVARPWIPISMTLFSSAVNYWVFPTYLFVFKETPRAIFLVLNDHSCIAVNSADTREFFLESYNHR